MMKIKRFIFFPYAICIKEYHLHNMKLTNCQNKVVIDPKKKMLIGNPNTVKIKNMIIKKICYWVSD